MKIVYKYWLIWEKVFIAPEHALRLLAALQDNVVCYEKEFGKMTATNPKSRDHASSLHSAMVRLKHKQSL